MIIWTSSSSFEKTHQQTSTSSSFFFRIYHSSSSSTVTRAQGPTGPTLRRHCELRRGGSGAAAPVPLAEPPLRWYLQGFDQGEGSAGAGRRLRCHGRVGRAGGKNMRNDEESTASLKRRVWMVTSVYRFCATITNVLVVEWCVLARCLLRRYTEAFLDHHSAGSWKVDFQVKRVLDLTHDCHHFFARATTPDSWSLVEQPRGLLIRGWHY